ncbi:MAG TPA: hypothetical protein VIB79_01180 [Candidatus Binatia bacterium]
MRRISFIAMMATVVFIGAEQYRSFAAESGQANPATSFFVSSAKHKTANLGGLHGADRICQDLAAAVGLGNKTWHAYLSVEHDPDNGNKPTDARSRIGNGPWVNSKGVVVAKNMTELNERKGDADVFLDEHGQKIPGNWSGSPKPVEHDILTGSTPEGTLMAGKTCNDWTSDSSSQQAQVGHTDGLGPGGDPSGRYSVWNSSHENGSCADTGPRGGAGRIYCFAVK